jgi:hypothetical protein
MTDALLTLGDSSSDDGSYPRHTLAHLAPYLPVAPRLPYGDGASSDEEATGLSLAVTAAAVMAYRLRRRNSRSRAGRRGGSFPGKRPNRDIGRSLGGERLRRDYFIRFDEPNPDGGYGPTFSEQDFARRFRMSRLVYNTIKDGVMAVDDYFTQKRDALGVLGASPDQKIAAALRQLSLGVGADSIVEYVRLSESTISDCLKHFCTAVVKRFASEYLRPPTLQDLQEIEAEYCKLGFPGCIGCLDCASWTWDKCPVANQGMYRGREKKPNIRMEVVCDDKLRIWHLFLESQGPETT